MEYKASNSELDQKQLEWWWKVCPCTNTQKCFHGKCHATSSLDDCSQGRQTWRTETLGLCSTNLDSQVNCMSPNHHKHKNKILKEDLKNS